MSITLLTYPSCLGQLLTKHTGARNSLSNGEKTAREVSESRNWAHIKPSQHSQLTSVASLQPTQCPKARQGTLSFPTSYLSFPSFYPLSADIFKISVLPFQELQYFAFLLYRQLVVWHYYTSTQNEAQSGGGLTAFELAEWRTQEQNKEKPEEQKESSFAITSVAVELTYLYIHMKWELQKAILLQHFIINP